MPHQIRWLLFAMMCWISLGVTAGCSGPAEPLTDLGAGGDGLVSGADAAGVKDCGGACRADQVCVEGRCQDVQRSCPCTVKETYCDLSSNTCKIGCVQDDQCATGRICDTASRTCRAGCRNDSACGAGQICDALSCRAGCRTDPMCGAGKICDMGSLTCKVGCRNDSACGAGQICDMGSLTCRAGCRLDTDCKTAGQICDKATLTCRTGCRMPGDCPTEQVCDMTKSMCVPGCASDTTCNAGRICEAGMCTDGCRMSATCPIGQYCDTTAKKCVAGCNGDTTRCAVGQACVRLVSGGYRCDANCYGWTCNGTGWTCYATSSSGGTTDYANSYCRKSCTAATDCAVTERCTLFTQKPSVPGSYSVHYCAKPCGVSGCADAVDGYAMSGTCSCAMDGACRASMGSAYECYHTSPAYGR